MTDDLDKSIDSYCKVWHQAFLLLLMAGTPGIFNAIQISLYVFLIDKPSYWCDVPVLKEAGWTDQMILDVSTPYQNDLSKKIEECSYYNRNYSIMVENGYNWSMKHLNDADTIPCQYYGYNNRVSVVSEWDLICDNVILKSNIQSAMGVGKFVGGLLFGSVSDIYGRKVAFNLAAFVYIVSGPFTALVDSYVWFLVVRFITGMAGSGIYESSYTILTELTSGETRTLLCLLMNLFYPIGYILLSIIAYYVRPWRMLLLVLSLPVFGLLIQCRFLPESPKWLMSRGKPIQAWAIMTKLVPSGGCTNIDLINEKVDAEIREPENSTNKFLEILSTFTSLFSTRDLSAKTCISFSCAFVCGLSYNVIALNGDNITADRYIYVASNGVVEGLAYMSTVPLLLHVGRKKSVSGLFFAAGIMQLALLAIPQDKLNSLLFVAMLGKFCTSAVFSVSLLFISELYPTTIRNTGLGSSLTIAQIGSIIAPYVVELLGAKAWYIPSTMCGILCVFVSNMVLMLPETQGTKLPNTLNEMKNTRPVRLTNCCNFK